MTARAHSTLYSRGLIRTYTVQAAGAVTKGMSVKLGTSEDEVLNASTNDKAIGYATETKAAGERVEICMAGYAIVPVLVGTGDATHGEHAIAAANGLTNQTLGGGTTVKYIEGIFLQTGVAGDTVALLVSGRFASGAA